MNSYAVGSKVVHPCYGAGTILRIQKKSIGDATSTYYVIRTTCRSMQVMVAVDRAESAGLRGVGEPARLRNMLSICSEPPLDSEIERDLRVRQNDMREQLKSGQFSTVVSVARILFYLNQRRPLGTIDRQLLEQGKDFLAAELALASDIEFVRARQEVEAILLQMITEGH
jgi:CarD family transcriptional regulator